MINTLSNELYYLPNKFLISKCYKIIHLYCIYHIKKQYKFHKRKRMSILVITFLRYQKIVHFGHTTSQIGNLESTTFRARWQKWKNWLIFTSKVKRDFAFIWKGKKIHYTLHHVLDLTTCIKTMVLKIESDWQVRLVRPPIDHSSNLVRPIGPKMGWKRIRPIELAVR